MFFQRYEKTSHSDNACPRCFIEYRDYQTRDFVRVDAGLATIFIQRDLNNRSKEHVYFQFSCYVSCEFNCDYSIDIDTRFDKNLLYIISLSSTFLLYLVQQCSGQPDVVLITAVRSLIQDMTKLTKPNVPNEYKNP